ncbi:MAG: hypothetical protein AABZ33_03155 [Chloroflexota bacterium]
MKVVVTGAAGFIGRATLIALAIVVAGCAQFEAADDLGATQLIVGREPGALTAQSRAWSAKQTLFVLCPIEPSESQEGLADAGTLQLDPSCQSYGLQDTDGGIDLRLGLGDIDASRRAAFDSAPEWWIVMIGVEGNSPRGIYKTVVRGGPIDPAVTPAPSPTPGPSPAGSTTPPGSAAP